MIELKQEEEGRVSIHRDGTHVGNAKALASKKNPLVSLTGVLRLSELEEIAKKLREVADQS